MIRQGGDHGCLITILLLIVAWPLAIVYWILRLIVWLVGAIVDWLTLGPVVVALTAAPSRNDEPADNGTNGPMANLLLGPLLRYVSEHEASVWVETDSPCAVEVRAGEVTGRNARSRSRVTTTRSSG